MKYVNLDSKIVELILKERDSNNDVSHYTYNLINISIKNIRLSVLLFDLD